tara:strand:+ start:10161 stop:10451 length:291 start_codon:yes stop_codon:yes gene_type:complete
MQSSRLGTIQSKEIEQTESLSINYEDESIVSFVEVVPADIALAMRTYMEKHPNWDQYRLVQAAISGFLLEKGDTSIEMRRFYSQSMFCKKSLRESL